MAIQRIFRALAFILSAFLLISGLASRPLFAQTVVTTNAGDESVNSLGWAVTNLNNPGAGAISIENSVGLITLSSSLSAFPVASRAVTFQGTAPGVIAQNDAQAQFLFQQSFTLDNSAALTLTNNGALSSGLDAAMTAASFNLSSNSSFSITGGVGAINAISGSAFVTLGTASAASGSAFQIQGGAGATGTGVGGGNGGSAAVSASTLSLSGATGIIAGGAGGADSYTNGFGGAATLSVGSLSLDTAAQLTLAGGNGGANTGAVGNGGNVFLGANSVSLTGTNTQLTVAGGTGADTNVTNNGPVNAGNGGSVSIGAASLTVDSQALLSVTGGSAGTVLPPGTGQGGIAGGVTVGLGTLALTNEGSMGVTAGEGGQGSKGTAGGNAEVTANAVTQGTGSTLSLITGAGGGNQSGGNLYFYVGSQTLASGATFIAASGSGGSGTAIGGSGGMVQVDVHAVSLASGSLWEITGGAGGTGTSSNGSGGGVDANLADLEGLGGTVTMGGSGPLTLQLTGGNFAGVIAGAEGLLVNSYGVVNLSGNNTYSGGTTLSNGTVIVSSDANLGTGNITLDDGTLQMEGPPGMGLVTSKAVSLTANGGTFYAGNTSSFNTFSGVISGPGGLEINGGGLVNFDAVNTYTGPTTVLNGGLYLNSGAQIAGPVTVDTAGTLMGNGTVLGAVSNNGVVQGGTSNFPATLTVASYTQTSNGFLQANLSPTQSSLLAVNGVANLGGAVTVDQLAGTYDNFRYRYSILSAGSISNSFNGTSGTYLPDWDSTLSYSSGLVSLILYRTNVDYIPWAVGANQLAVAKALNAAVSTGSDSLAVKLNEIYALPSGQGAVLGQLTGNLYTALPNVLLDNLQFEDSLLFDRLDGGVGSAMGGAQAGLVRDIVSAEVSGPAGNAAGLANPGVGGLWVENTDSAGTVNGDSNNGSFNKSNYGFLAGYDTELSKGFTGGIMGGYVHTDITSSDSSQTAGINGTQFGLYGRKQFGALGVGLVAGYSLDHFTANRGVSIGSDVTQLAGAYDGGQIQAALQGDYALDFSGFTLKPLVGLQYAHLSENAFTETGSDSLALSVPAQSYDSLRPYLGVEGFQYLALDQDLGLLPRVNVSVSEEMMDSAAGFATALNGAPGNSFTVTGITPSATTISLEAGTKLVFGKQFNLFANYQGHFSGTENLNTFNGGLDIAF